MPRADCQPARAGAHGTRSHEIAFAADLAAAANASIACTTVPARKRFNSAVSTSTCAVPSAARVCCDGGGSWHLASR